MSGPFPGMDPYLEDPANWQGHHNALIAYLWSAILAVLPENYDAAMEDRCYIVQPERDIVPDLTVFRAASISPPEKRGNTAVLEPDAPLILRILPLEVHEVFLNIYRRGDRSRVITAIELLSPTNKAANTEGWRQYRRKQKRVLKSQTHFLEIDLLRGGAHTVAVAPEALSSRGDWDYLACLHRGGEADSLEVWPCTIRERLPRVSAPLSTGDQDLVLDLQAVLDRFYEEGRFLRRLNYLESPIPPLRSDDAAWADSLLKTKGLRPSTQ
jgi:hypothetical protein